jgi:hypothetical protein
MAKSTKTTPTEEELAALAAAEETTVEETPVVEEVATGWQGHPTRAYRSFAVPYGAATVESVNEVTDGQQEEPQV